MKETKNNIQKVLFMDYRSLKQPTCYLSNSAYISFNKFKKVIINILEDFSVPNILANNKVLNIILFEENEYRVSINVIENNDLFEFLYWNNIKKKSNISRMHCVRLFLNESRISLVYNDLEDSDNIKSIDDLEEIFSLVKRYFEKFDFIIFPHFFSDSIIDKYV